MEYNITLSVCDIDFARRLSAYAVSVGKRAKVHIKLNTGMSRVGFDCLNENQAEAAADMIEEKMCIRDRYYVWRALISRFPVHTH